MIQKDQPTCFPDNVVVRVSSVEDGTVLDKLLGVHHPSIVSSREKFCQDVGLEYSKVVYQRIVYDDKQTYDKIVEVNELDTTAHKQEIPADALVTDEIGTGLFLPVADCVATVLYDPTRRCLALIHLGRHSSLTNIIGKTIDLFVKKGSRQQDLIVWMSPNVHQSHYRMKYFQPVDTEEWQPFVEVRNDGFYIDLQGHNRQAFINAGVPADNIYLSSINTATDNNYYSHIQGDTNGRFAVLVQMI